VLEKERNRQKQTNRERQNLMELIKLSFS
jgi:hypothetical protein